MLSKNIFLTIILLIFVCTPAFSLQMAEAISTDDPDTPQRGLTINEENLSCFQSLQCLKRENPFQKSNLEDIKLNNQTDRFVVEGSTKNETLYAEYDGNGELIKATVIQRNIVLPRTINRVLTTGELENWMIIGNELVIENFDKSRMEYKVILEHEGEVRVEYFDHKGEHRNRLS